MPDDFDLDSLAAYLHLTPQQVSRLADRGKLPGRKIGGQWRFAEAEVHHWLEDRIGLSDDDELAQVESVLQQSNHPDVVPAFAVTEMLLPEAIAVPLAARTRNSVINAMCQLASGTGLLWDADKMADAVRARESLHPTALESGVALLHPRRPQTSILAQAFLALGRTSHGIPFGGKHGGLTDLFFLVCSVDDRGHLQALARLSRLVSDEQCLSDLREAEDATAMHRVIAQYEAALSE